MILIDSVVVELSRRTIQHSRFENGERRRRQGRRIPCGWVGQPSPPLGRSARVRGRLCGPMVDEVPAADGAAAQAAAHPPKVMALPQQVLASNEAIVASTQAIAARVTAIEIAQGRACSTCRWRPNPLWSRSGRASCSRGAPAPLGHSRHGGFPYPVRRPPPAWPSRPTPDWRPSCGDPWPAPSTFWRGGASA